MKSISARLFRRYRGADWLLRRKAKTMAVLALVTLVFLLADMLFTTVMLGHTAPQLGSNALVVGGLCLGLWLLLQGHYQVASGLCILVVLLGMTYTRIAITGKFGSAGAYDFIQYVLDLVVIVFYSNLIAQRKRTLVLTLSSCLGFLALYAYLLGRGGQPLAAPTASVVLSGFLFFLVAGLINFLSFLQNQKAIQVARQESDASRENEAKYRSLFEHAGEGLFILSPEGRILEVNESFARMHGYRLDEWRQVRLEDFESPEAGSYGPGRMAELLAGANLTFEVSHRHRDGHRFPLEVSASLVAQGGKPVILNFHRDITERKRAEQEQARLQSQLAQAQRLDSLGSLAGGVAHDMNNVLGAILAMASTRLEADPGEGPARQAFATIAQAAARGGQMVKSLLSFARQSPAEERELDLDGILREVVKLLERTTLAKVRLELELEAGLRPIRGDASALTHAIMNLCVNAVDAMPEGGTLTLRTRNLDGSRVEAEVADTGVGMPREVLRQAMDPFFTTKPVGQGTGLGLTLVYSTVKAHRGELDLESQPGQGTTVRLRFPASAPAAPAPAPAPAGAAPAPRPLSVLLVDDDELIQEAVKALLQVLGHTVHPARSGEAALAQLEAGLRPDRVILDLNMPGLGGSGTLPRLLVLCPTARVVLATGRVDQAALELARAHPAVTLLAKPFTVRDLQAHLDPLRAGEPSFLGDPT